MVRGCQKETGGKQYRYINNNFEIRTLIGANKKVIDFTCDVFDENMVLRQLRSYIAYAKKDEGYVYLCDNCAVKGGVRW